MDGAEKIINKIKSDAQLQAENNIKKAQEEAEAIIKAAEEEALKKYNSIIEITQNEVIERKKRLIAMAELEARKIKLKAKQDLISQVFSLAHKKLTSLSPEEYRNILSEMILSLNPEGDEELIVSEEDRKKLGNTFLEMVNKKLNENKIKGEVKYSGECRQTEGGFILKSGDIETNCSFSSILRMEYNKIEAEVIKVLFHNSP
jgi:V/A-type H+-transporting ATPase subunit E